MNNQVTTKSIKKNENKNIDFFLYVPAVCRHDKRPVGGE